jgi:hypothetical protein
MGVSKARKKLLANRAYDSSQLRCFYSKQMLSILIKDHSTPSYEIDLKEYHSERTA